MTDPSMGWQAPPSDPGPVGGDFQPADPGFFNDPSADPSANFDPSSFGYDPASTLGDSFPPYFTPDLHIPDDPYGYQPPDPPGFDVGYVAPDPPPLDASYMAPDPPPLDASYMAPDPPFAGAGYETADLQSPVSGADGGRDGSDTASVADAKEAKVMLAFEAPVWEPPAWDKAGTFHASDLNQADSLGRPGDLMVTVPHDGHDVAVHISAATDPRSGMTTIEIKAGTDERATISLPTSMAHDVTISIHPSADPSKIADVSVTANTPVEIQEHGSRDIGVQVAVPFGPATPPDAAGQGSSAPTHPPHHASHHVHQDTHAPAADFPVGRADPPATPAAPDPGLPPAQHAPDPNVPPLDHFLKQDPPPTGFEAKIAGNQPFTLDVTVQPDIDLSAAHWLGRPPSQSDQQTMRTEVVGDPSATAGFGARTFPLTIDPAFTMPIRDPATDVLLGYRVRQGETWYRLDRNGHLLGSGGYEQPLESPTVDPIDVAMIAVDLGPIVAKGVSTGAAAILATASREASAKLGPGPTIARFGDEAVAELSSFWRSRLARETDPAARARYERALKALADRDRIRDWRQSEDEVAYLYKSIGGKGETPEYYKDAAGEWRMTKPDFIGPNVRGEVKNWEVVHISSERAANELLDNLARQVADRSRLPNPMQQTVVLDLRAQALSETDLQTIGHTLAERTGLPVQNIQLIIWDKPTTAW